jgi:tRNA modification GTPase
VVENKNDLDRSISSSDYPEDSKVITTSMINNDCSENIISEIEKVLTVQFKINPSSDILVSKRQSNHLVDTLAHLNEVISLISSSFNEEIILQELKLSIECINCIIGRTDNEDMLDQLFENFCIGK